MNRARRIANVAAIIVGASVYAAYVYWRNRGHMRETIRAGIIASGVRRDDLIRHEMMEPETTPDARSQ